MDALDIKLVQGLSCGAGCEMFMGFNIMVGKDEGLAATTFLFGSLVGLYWPDIDHVFLKWLHHRSILTHSILLPLMLWVLLDSKSIVVSNVIAGLLVGIAIHLCADFISPAVGFGMIWLPAPIKTGLGPLSYVWVFGNICAAIWVMREYFTGKNHLYGLTSLIIAQGYFMVNERSAWPLLPMIAAVWFVLWLEKRQSKNKVG